MFKLETLNELTCKATSVDGRGALYTKAGAMIAYTGQCKFEKVLLGPQGNPMGALLGQIGRRLTGENMPLMKIEASSGSVSFFANLSQHVTVVDLMPGMELKVESENLLAFTENCDYSFKFLAQGAISQKGLFTSVLKAKSQGAQVAILTDGNPIVVPTPCFVDPDAIVSWTGPDPGLHLDLGWRNLIGQSSGESYSFKFEQPGGQVIVQPSERESGLSIGVDDNRYTPDVQNNQSLGDAMGNIGDTASNIGNMLGNLFR
ncbi:AIM24 family protein [uncultured Clostridium sp.]|uniref:AIM24 family protein n=1 Tax=uncultured Clostridium sp. TaxID=59620 RepID=UPI00345C159C